MVEEICYICQEGILEHEHSELLAWRSQMVYSSV